jgi:hypothetical protein
MGGFRKERPDRVAIVGARAHPDLDEVRAYVQEEVGDSDIVISGGADGVDRAAEEEAVVQGHTVVSYRIAPVSQWKGGLAIDDEGRLGVVEVIYNPASAAWKQARRWILPVGTSRRDALIFRNTFIVIAADVVVAFTRGTRGGTRDTITQARRFHRTVYERGKPPESVLLGSRDGPIDTTPKKR